MCQRTGQDGRPTAWWAQPLSAAAWRPRSPVSAPAVTVRRAADALPYSRSGLGCQENAARSPVPPGDRAGSDQTAIPSGRLRLRRTAIPPEGRLRLAVAGKRSPRTADETAHRISSRRPSSLRCRARGF